MTRAAGVARQVLAALVVLSGLAGPAVAVASPMSMQARELHAWVLGARDNEGAPFAVIDKRQARLWLFDAQGRRVGSTPVLLGMARGDASVPGIGERPIKEILPHERTTPAGRFVTEPGHNAQGEDILWVDYEAAVSMHRVRANNPVERRLQRLDSRTPSDNRISYGCINVPAVFYDRHLRPRFTQARGVVYLLPETLPLQALFRSDPAQAPQQAKPVTPNRRASEQVAGKQLLSGRSMPTSVKAPVVAQTARADEAQAPTPAQARAIALLFARPDNKDHRAPTRARPADSSSSTRQALKAKTPRPI